jgi:hypothetical protein
MAFLLAVGIALSAEPINFELRFILGVFIAAVVGAVGWNLFRIPCPRCHEPLGSAGFWAANGSQSDAASHCPLCRVGFDEMMQIPPT